MNLELKIILTVIFLGYSLFFLFTKQKSKSLIPLMGAGFLLGPNCWNLLGKSIENFALFFLFPAIFILGMQMGRGLDLKFWKNFPAEAFFNNLFEKIILICIFLGFFFLIIPSMLFIPDSFPFYFSIAAFSISFFFVFSSFISPPLREKMLAHYKINNLILISFFILFHIAYPPVYTKFIQGDLLDQLFYISFFTLFILIMIKIRIENFKTLGILWLSLVLLGSVFSQSMGIFPLIFGFIAGIFSNYMPIRPQLSLKQTFFFFNEYLLYLFTFIAGFLMQISFIMILLGLFYLLVRLFSRFTIQLMVNKQMSFEIFFKKDAFFLLQGEYLLAFLLIYAIEYRFNEILSIGLLSLVFSDILLYIYSHKFQKAKAIH